MKAAGEAFDFKGRRRLVAERLANALLHGGTEVGRSQPPAPGGGRFEKTPLQRNAEAKRGRGHEPIIARPAPA